MHTTREIFFWIPYTLVPFKLRPIIESDTRTLDQRRGKREPHLSQAIGKFLDGLRGSIQCRDRSVHLLAIFFVGLPSNMLQRDVSTLHRVERQLEHI